MFKIISKKKYNQIIEHKDKSINDSQARVLKLEQELEEARDLKLILEKLYPFASGNVISINNIGGIRTVSWNFPDTVLQYEEDILGGKVIKQEGTKCLVVDKEGNVKTGLTKQKPDKGYSYKLVRN